MPQCCHRSRAYFVALSRVCYLLLAILPLLSAPLLAGDFFNQPTLLNFEQEVSFQKDTADKFYAIELKQGESYSVLAQTQQNAGYVQIELFQPDDATQRYSDLGNLYNNSYVARELIAPVSGRYTFKISRVAASVKILILRSFAQADVTDTNRQQYVTMNTARYLTAGNYQHTGKAEYFRFEARAGDLIGINLSSNQDSGTSNFQLFTPSKPTYRVAKQVTFGNNDRDSWSLVAQTSGVYYLEVLGTAGRSYTISTSGIRADADDDQDGLSNSAEWFRGSDLQQADSNADGISDLAAARSGQRGLYAVEWQRADVVNASSPLTAVPVPYLDKKFSLQLDGAAKYLSLELTQGEAVAVESALWFGRGTVELQAFAPDGSPYAFYGKSQYNNGRSSVFEFTAQISGRYLLKIEPTFGLAELAVYRGFANTDVASSGVANSDQNSESNEYQPNLSTRATASYLTSAEVLFSGQDQYWRFAARAGDDINLMFSTKLNVGRMEFTLYAPDEQTAFLSSSGMTDGQQRGLSFIARQTGVYLLKVTGDAGIWSVAANGLRADSDEDGDGLSLSAEYWRGLDPLKADSNNNGLSDLADLQAGRTGRYSIEWSQADLALAITADTAKPIPFFNKTWTIAYAGGKRYLRLPLIAGQRIAVRLQSQSTRGTVLGSVLSPKGGRIRWTSSLSNNEAGVMSFTAAVSGFYSLELTGDAAQLTAEVHYGFATALLTPLRTDFHGSLNTASYLQAGEYQRTTEAQFYRLEMAAGETVQLSMLAKLLRGSLTMALLTGMEGDEKVISSSYSTSNGETASLALTAAQAGVYYVRIDGAAGAYTLQTSTIKADVDSDKDGLSNTAEWVRGTHVYQADTNGNQVPDLLDGQLGRLGRHQVEWLAADLVSAQTRASALALPYWNKALTLHLIGERRFFSLPLKAGEKITLSARTLVDETSQSVHLYAPENGTFEHELSIHTINSQLHRNADYIATVTGTYMLEVDGGAGVMDLAVYRGYDHAGISDENRDFYQTALSARVLTPGLHWATPAGNVFRFTGKAGRAVGIGMTPTTNLTSYRFYVTSAADTSRNLLTAYDVRDGETASKSFTPAVDGTYLLFVYGVQGSFQLQLSGVDIPTYSITSSAKPEVGGSVSCDATTVSYGNSTKCQAVASSGYRFSHWGGDCRGAQCVMQNIRRNREVAAYFVPVYSIKATGNSERGSIEVTEFSTIAGSKIQFKVSAKPGFKLQRFVSGTCPEGQWLDDNTYETGAINADCEVEFNFSPDQPRKGLPWWVLMAAQAGSQ